MDKRWVVAPSVPPETAAQFPELHPVILQILWNRGLRTQAEMDLFLGPEWSRDVYGPELFRQMPEAVARVFEAIRDGQPITVHGDYDADGVCGSTVMMSTLREIGRAMKQEIATSVFLPHREKDGYGLSVKTVEQLYIEGTRLIITVDCGISNNAAITRAKSMGIDVIVCDHHQMPETLPTEAILLHPLVPGETYPNKKLCGTGVAFKLACGLIEEAQRRGLVFAKGYEKWLLDLVAIATVTDVMPITGENRLLEKYGLVVLNKTRRVGLQQLLKVAGLEEKVIDTWSIGFQIGPRLNAAGRMNHARGAYDLLMCEDRFEAGRLAATLNQSNVDRQKASDELYRIAKTQIGEAGDRKILFAVGDRWPVGLAGLVAGKLMNDYALPIFVICKNEEGKFVGSGRSMHGFDVTAAMKKAAHTLDRFGGHPQACGMSCLTEVMLAEFQEVMAQEAASYFAEHDPAPTLALDAEIHPKDVDWNLMEQLERLEPFGEGNPKPLFVGRRLKITGIDTVGADRAHLRLTTEGGRKFIGFRFGDWVHRLHLDDMIDVAFEVGMNEWNGRKELQFRIVDLCLNTSAFTPTVAPEETQALPAQA